MEPRPTLLWRSILVDFEYLVEIARHSCTAVAAREVVVEEKGRRRWNGTALLSYRVNIAL
jgi:hypothetical protein